ncbi:MAG: 6-carboxytetrahydropterin synthase [Rikenellaceae bacterium]
MAKIRLTKQFTFEMAHALDGYDGSCRHIHGHSYILYVTIIGEPVSNTSDPKCGMVIDFKVLKEIINRLVIDRYDHALVCNSNSSKLSLFKSMSLEFGKVVFVDYQPTCENMITHIAEEVSKELPCGVALHHIKLHETATSFAEWYLSDNI